MTKDDIQPNDIVTTRDKLVSIAYNINGELALIDGDSYVWVREYCPNMKMIDDTFNLSGLDIMKIQRPKNPWELCPANFDKAPAIWERIEINADRTKEEASEFISAHIDEFRLAMEIESGMFGYE